MQRNRALLIVLGLGYLFSKQNILLPPSQAAECIHEQTCNALNKREYVGAVIKPVKRITAEYNISGVPMISILLESSHEIPFDISLQRSKVKEGYSIQSYSLNRPEIELRAHWQGERFVQSREHPTAVNVKVRSIRPEETVIYLSGTLVNPGTGAYLTLAPSLIKIPGEQINTLLAGLQR